MTTATETRAAGSAASPAAAAAAGPIKKKLHGRAFYESIGSPKYVVAPMVDQSEFAWRMLTRSYMAPEEAKQVLAYTPMFHARLFAQDPRYRASHFQATRAAAAPSRPASPAAADASPSSTDAAAAAPWLDGNPALDRPLFVQFCANDPEILLEAARHAAPHCDAVDINFGCPQGIAKRGHYGSFLQEDQDLVYRLVKILHDNLDVPVTAKIRILDTKEATLAYAQNVLRAGASILTVHGRRRAQKGHLTGLADWSYLRYLRDNLPRDTVLFANGNILQHADLAECLRVTGADAVMSAEGNLSDPALFAGPPAVADVAALDPAVRREYWVGRDGRGGWRVDGVLRRYFDLLYRYAAEQEPPARRPLWVPGDATAWLEEAGAAGDGEGEEEDGPARKKRKTTGKVSKSAPTNPNFAAVQTHLFHLLRHFVSRHTDVRDMLARSVRGDLAGYEAVLLAVEKKVARGLQEYEKTGGKSWEDEQETYIAEKKRAFAGEGKGEKKGEEKDEKGEKEEKEEEKEEEIDEDGPASSIGTLRRCIRPWWIVQPIIRPLPNEALAKGSIALSKKKMKAQTDKAEETEKKKGDDEQN
ncbi:hypothetical protein TD95_003727 [Thielaviopsis punctulata]|uniref:tRNA-dihydrouridine(16/17) synthase [NAD(P)(+)] n=1 Tax=Thielaviopsis punctulata TaxID=72032 RepID=A0A0F4ZDB2_9PEZI|nr:hypothetical protein TD95_003727 [Thielaviopsis punctulata]